MAKTMDSDDYAFAADKLSRGKKGYSDVEKPGYLKHAQGRWRSPELHAEILSLFTRAYELNPKETGTLYRRALEKLLVDDVAGAEADLSALAAVGSPHATGSLPIWISLRKNDRKTAQQYLDSLNVVNKQRGVPKQKLADFEWF